ncbi:hypothetical protein AB1Y20_016642 [Prymnesium parvum]|uniref:Uncharacterized protein n=1 Tax=Prymnesium parvum TaxID=97485 RepID=A0AB34IC94_PRYPA
MLTPAVEEQLVRRAHSQRKGVRARHNGTSSLPASSLRRRPAVRRQCRLMGCGASVVAPEAPKQLVLLGGGECGKTTIFKQITILHSSGFSDEKAMEWVPSIHRSLLRSMQVVSRRVRDSGKLEAMLPEDKERVTRVLEAADSATSTLTAALAADIKSLWENAAVQEVMHEADASGQHDGRDMRLDLDDNALFFLNKVEEIAKPGFRPSDEEILKVRDPTRTIETVDFQANKTKFRVIDVGGQRMERPKWNLTGEITAVIFVCALTEYNQVLREDVKQNRLKESINLFDIACNRRYPDKPIILFLNKLDLFEEQIKKVDLNVCFPAYKGGKDAKRALEFIRWKFTSIIKDKDKDIYIKETTATDPKNMEHILNSVYEIVLRQNLTQSGFG